MDIGKNRRLKNSIELYLKQKRKPQIFYFFAQIFFIEANWVKVFRNSTQIFFAAKMQKRCRWQKTEIDIFDEKWLRLFFLPTFFNRMRLWVSNLALRLLPRPMFFPNDIFLSPVKLVSHRWQWGTNLIAFLPLYVVFNPTEIPFEVVYVQKLDTTWLCFNQGYCDNN